MPKCKCLTFEEIFSSGRPRIERLRQVGDSYQSGNEPGACQAFGKEVDFVTSLLRGTYATGMLYLRKEEDLEAAMSIVHHLRDFSQEVMKALSSLKEKYPHCGAGSLYDLALDYWKACQSRYENLQEEAKCQMMPPKGLFPELS